MSTPVAYARALSDVWQETPAAQRGELLDRFVAQLQADGMLDLAPAVLRELERREADAAADASVTVVSARPLSSAVLESILQVVRPMLPSVAATPQAQMDPALVGGFIVRTPTLEIDACVHRVLGRLHA